jgi:hypothetical protein
VYVVELRFAIPDVTSAPSPDVIVEGLRRSRRNLSDRIEYVRIRRQADMFYAVLFVLAASSTEAEVVGGIVGFAVATEIPAVRFVGTWSWPVSGDAPSGADPETDAT